MVHVIYPSCYKANPSNRKGIMYSTGVGFGEPGSKHLI